MSLKTRNASRVTTKSRIRSGERSVPAVSGETSSHEAPAALFKDDDDDGWYSDGELGAYDEGEGYDLCGCTGPGHSSAYLADSEEAASSSCSSDSGWCTASALCLHPGA